MQNRFIDLVVEKSKGKIDKYVVGFCFVCGLVGGFVCGVVGGLLSGLVGGLVCSLFGGLLCGFFCGLGSDFVFGVVSGLVFCLVFGSGYLISICLISAFKYPPIFTFVAPSWIYPLITIMVVLIIAEIMFLFEKEKPKKRENIFWFTVIRKSFNILIASLIYMAVSGFIKLVRQSIPYIQTHLDDLLLWSASIVIALIFFGFFLIILYAFIELNSLKYKKRRK